MKDLFLFYIWYRCYGSMRALETWGGGSTPSYQKTKIILSGYSSAGRARVLGT